MFPMDDYIRKTLLEALRLCRVLKVKHHLEYNAVDGEITVHLLCPYCVRTIHSVMYSPMGNEMATQTYKLPEESVATAEQLFDEFVRGEKQCGLGCPMNHKG